jgi:hypoxanthine phosphoribosyltransferase
VLISTLIGTGVVVIVRRSTSQDHTDAVAEFRVKKLKDKLVEDQFLPQLIIAIPRGGLAVAGNLACQLGEKKIVPVICLNPSQNLKEGFDSPFNYIQFTRSDFGRNGEDPINILIVDDICASGRTLDSAKTYVEDSLKRNDFGQALIKTAVISLYRSHSRRIEPSYYVEISKKQIRDASGEVEPMPN